MLKVEEQRFNSGLQAVEGNFIQTTSPKASEFLVFHLIILGI